MTQPTNPKDGGSLLKTIGVKSRDAAIGAVIGAVITIFSVLFAARFSPLLKTLESVVQRDEGRIDFDFPSFVYAGDSNNFNPQIVPKSSKILHATLLVQTVTDNISVVPAMTTFTLDDVTKATHLADLWKDRVTIDASHEGAGVIELTLISGGRNLDTVVKPFTVRPRYEGKWTLRLNEIEGGMDLAQHGSDIFGVYNLEGGGYGAVQGKIDGGYFQADFIDSKAVRRWRVRGPVREQQKWLLVGGDHEKIATPYNGGGNGWVPTSDTTFFAMKNPQS